MSQPSTVSREAPAPLQPPAPYGRVAERCRNCDAALAGPFCAECGQRHHEHLDPSLREIAHEAGEELLHLDGKLLDTLRLLLTAPGRLTREFLEGRRARYLSPLRLYLTCSVVFFFVMALVPVKGDLGIGTVKEETAAGTVSRPLNAAERDSLARMFERKAKKVGGIWGAGLRGFARAEAEPDAARHEMVQAMPKIMFVLVPFFALVTGLVYRRRRLHYPTHLIFALHVFAFYFTISAVARLTRLTGVPAVGTVAGLAVMVATLGYLWLALRRMYGGRRWTTALRLVTVLFLFGVGFLTVIMGSALVVLGRG
jgi:Protein of unknown function (DUF3667)